MTTAITSKRVHDITTALIAAFDVTIPRYTRSIRHAIELAEGEERITMPQLRCIQAIGRAGGESLTTALARELGVTAPTMTRMLDGLAERGVIERRPDPASRRQIRILLTQEGWTLLKRCNAIVERQIGAILAHLDERQRERLLAAIADLDSALDERAATEHEPEAGA